MSQFCVPTIKARGQLARAMDAVQQQRSKEGGAVSRLVRCDWCGNFLPWRGELDSMPGEYNPCSRGHAMRFRMPTGHPDYAPETWGFERPRCLDLIAQPAPRPRPWPPAPPPRTRPVLAWVRPWTPARG